MIWPCSKSRLSNIKLQFQGVMQYVNVGQYPADSFFEIDQLAGQIVLERNLKQDYARRKQYLVAENLGNLLLL